MNQHVKIFKMSLILNDLVILVMWYYRGSDKVYDIRLG